MPKTETILLLNPGPKARIIIPKGKTMATKTKKKHGPKKGKMPAALKAYWESKRENPKKRHHPAKAHHKKAHHKKRHNPGPARRSSSSSAKGFKKYLSMDLLKDAGLGLLGYGAARVIANQAARFFPRKPTDTSEPMVLRLVGVVQFAAGAFLAVKVPKARGIGLGLCIAGLQDGIRRNVPAIAPYLGADDEAILAYAPMDLGSDAYYMAALMDLGADDNFLAAPMDLSGDDEPNYGY